jgi:tetratricopeptide (TPR) repeat protein
MGLEESNTALRRASALARTDPMGALLELDAALAASRINGDSRSISLLARHAGAICTGIADLAGAAAYYDEAARYAAEDGYVQFASGSAWQQLGQPAKAREALSKALVLGEEHSDADLIAITSAALKALPDDNA